MTEAEIVKYLEDTPDFFERNAQMLANVRLASPHGARTINLQERQVRALQDKVRQHENHVMEMIRHGSDNILIADKLLQWACEILLVPRAIDIPDVILRGLKERFDVPQIALRLWDLADIYADEPFTNDVSDNVKSLAYSLKTPYCGANTGFEATNWLSSPQDAASIVMLALRDGLTSDSSVFGLLVLASPNADKYSANAQTDFLERIGELAGAALSRLR